MGLRRSHSEAGAGAALLEAMLGEAGSYPLSQLAIVERVGESKVPVTYGELLAQIEHATSWLIRRGVGFGDVVAVWLPNWSEVIALEFALANLGAASLGVNTRYSVHELRSLLERGRPKGVVMPGDFLGLDFAGRLRQAWQNVESAGLEAPWVATVRRKADGADGGEADGADGCDLGGGVEAMPALDSQGGRFGQDVPRADALKADPLKADPPLGSAIVNYFTTSGSSGMPKLAGHSQSAVALHSRNVASAFDMRPGDVFLSVLPLTGVFGFNPAMGMLAAGGCCLLEPIFDVETVLADMQELGVTHVVGGDDMLGRLMDGWDAGMRPTVRRGGIADFAGRAAAVVSWAAQAWGAPLGGVYGSSEIFALTATWGADLPLSERARGGGCPVSPGIEVRAVDPESGRRCEQGEVGELQFKGYNVLEDYRGSPDVAAEAFTADGWFRSGDLGFMTGDGGDFVYVCRNSDALRLRGFLVEPEEIEGFLASHEAVDVARVVGVSTSDRGQAAVAFVTLRQGGSATEQELIAHCRAQLAPFKVPTRINVIEQMPVTAGTNGTKIRTAELRRRAAEQLGEAGDSAGGGAGAAQVRSDA